MTSPDLTPYTDLTLFDRSAEDIFEIWLTQVRSRLPDYLPVETNTEVVVAEGLALEVAEEVFAINRLPAATIEGVLRLFGVERDQGAAPTTTLTFSVGDIAGHAIPAGTRAVLPLAGGREPVVFTTTAELLIAPGSNIGTVAALGSRFTADANGYAPGTLLELLDSISFAEQVTLGSQPINGRDPEDVQQWLSRGVSRFDRLSDAITLPRHFTSYALDFGIYRAHTVDQYNPAIPGARPGDHPGHVAVAVYGKGDLPVPDVTKQELAAALIPLSAPHLIKHIMDPTVTTVNVSASVAAHSGYDPLEVRAAADQAIRDYLNSDTWPWQALVRRTRLIALLAGVEGVAYVTNLTTPSADVTLAGVANLTRAGTVSVSVVLEGT